MRLSRTKIAVLALIAGLGIGVAVAQTVVQTAISGNEVWRAAQGPGGPEQYIAINTVRGSAPITTTSRYWRSNLYRHPGTLCWLSTAPTTWVVTLPAAPADGTIVKLCSDTTLTTRVDVVAGSGDTLTTTFASQTVTANASFPAWQYKASTKIWYRVQ